MESIRNPRRAIQNPRLFWISLHGVTVRHVSPIPASRGGGGGGGTLRISGWECAAGTLEPLTYTRASSAIIATLY